MKKLLLSFIVVSCVVSCISCARQDCPANASHKAPNFVTNKNSRNP